MICSSFVRADTNYISKFIFKRKSYLSVDKRVIFFYNDTYMKEVPTTSKFPIQKYRLVREALQSRFSNDNRVAFCESPQANFDELATTHSPNYIWKFLNGQLSPLEMRRTGFNWSPHDVSRATSSVGGTLAATRKVLENSNIQGAGQIAGGTHHAFYDYGEGYCIFNDIAVATNIALRDYGIKRILIIDLDVHQGNGTAVLLKNDQRVTTFSMHCSGNFFSKKEFSTYDVELEPGSGDDVYLSKLEFWLNRLFDSTVPELVFYQAGVDILQGDRLGKLKVSFEGIQRRNAMVFDAVKCANSKIVMTMGGGYPRDLNPESQPYQNLILAHSEGYIQCVQTFL